MRRFHSYGTADYEQHFCVQRKELIRQCMDYLIGDLDRGGHYFTVWGARQTGKTWLIRQVEKLIKNLSSERFIAAYLSMQGVVMEEDEPVGHFLRYVPRLFLDGFDLEIPALQTWEDFTALFQRKTSPFDRPVVLFIDEFDVLPKAVINRLMSLFRDIFLKRESYLLHGMAVVGVKALQSADSQAGDPFNIQRSLHVPNLSKNEVREMFEQYQDQSAQKIEPAVTDAIFEVTRGQPGLVSWFGELLTEKFNPGRKHIIRKKDWDKTYLHACSTEWNPTIANLIGKAKGEYRDYIIELFGRADIAFTIRADWCAYLYLNGIIDYDLAVDANGKETSVSRFSSPYIQQSLYDALTYTLIGDRTPILALDPLDDLTDVFDKPFLNVPAIVRRYQHYLKRLKDKGLDFWKTPSEELRFTEVIGHFHLYSWLKSAIGRYCSITPRLPAGNGKVDLHIRCDAKEGVIEVIRFTDSRQIRHSAKQAAEYAAQVGLKAITLVFFVPVEDEGILQKLSAQGRIANVQVTICAIGVCA
jgi:hypothetical protein